jgi:predicted lipid carrier protein YhbT
VRPTEWHTDGRDPAAAVFESMFSTADISLPSCNRDARKVIEVIPETVRTSRFELSAADVPRPALYRAAGQSGRVRWLEVPMALQVMVDVRNRGLTMPPSLESTSASRSCLDLDEQRNLLHQARRTSPDTRQLFRTLTCDTLASNMPHAPR